MSSEYRGDRRDFLKQSATVVAAATALHPFTAHATGGGGGKGQLGLVGADHVGLTVPDIGEAVAWFQDVMGASAPPGELWSGGRTGPPWSRRIRRSSWSRPTAGGCCDSTTSPSGRSSRSPPWPARS